MFITRSGTLWPPAQQDNHIQDAQKGRPARPQASRNRRRTLGGFVEDFEEPRTKLTDFFSILLEQI
jgi:hypothetical protein